MKRICPDHQWNCPQHHYECDNNTEREKTLKKKNKQLETNPWYIYTCSAGLFLTLKRVQDTEDIVGRDDHVSITEESHGPRQAQENKQTQDHHQTFLQRCSLDVAHFHVSCLNNFGDDRDEDACCETEDQGIVADVHYVVNVVICDPAPVMRK